MAGREIDAYSLPPGTLARILRRAEQNERGCWLWTGARSSRGYGVISFNGRLAYTHRMVLAASGVSVPPNTVVMHACDTPACVNLRHLRLGTQAQNLQDMVRKGRHRPRGAARRRAAR